MASNYTKNYKLCQWEAADKVVRTDFNEDNAKIEAALTAEANARAALQTAVNGKASTSALSSLQSTVSSLQTAVAGKQDSTSAVKFKAGTYTGNDAAERTISVGFTPKAVWVTDRQGSVGSASRVGGGLAVTGAPVLYEAGVPAVSIVSGGFKVYLTIRDNIGIVNTNGSGKEYHYIAFG